MTNGIKYQCYSLKAYGGSLFIGAGKALENKGYGRALLIFVPSKKTYRKD